MHGFITGIFSLSGAVVWLTLLLATNFNSFVVGGGLLVGVYLIGSTTGEPPRRPGHRSIHR